MKITLSLACMFLAGIAALSQTIFTGANGQDWQDPGNWSDGLPNQNNFANIPVGQTVVNTADLFIDFNVLNDGTIVNEGNITNNATANVAFSSIWTFSDGSHEFWFLTIQ